VLSKRSLTKNSSVAYIRNNKSQDIVKANISEVTRIRPVTSVNSKRQSLESAKIPIQEIPHYQYILPSRVSRRSLSVNKSLKFMPYANRPKHSLLKNTNNSEFMVLPSHSQNKSTTSLSGGGNVYRSFRTPIDKVQKPLK